MKTHLNFTHSGPASPLVSSPAFLPLITWSQRRIQPHHSWTHCTCSLSVRCGRAEFFLVLNPLSTINHTSILFVVLVSVQVKPDSSTLWGVVLASLSSYHSSLCFCVLCWSIYVVYYLFTFCLPKCRFFVFVFWLRPKTCPIIVPWPGTEPRSLGVKVLNPNHRTTRDIPRGSFTTTLSTHLNKRIPKWISNEYMCISIPAQHNVSIKNTALDVIIEISSYTKKNDKSELIRL